MIRILENDRDEDSSIDLTKEVDAVFKSGGWLQKALDFDHRGEQAQMAASVSRSLLRGEHLLFEAGTGVGKSLAYLIPSILFAKTRQRPCVVATNTISLQEQLLWKDIPAVRKLLKETPNLSELADFKCALLVGRANYLCPPALRRQWPVKANCSKVAKETKLQRISQWLILKPGKELGRNSRLLPWVRSGMR